jgi:hypothetical protein
VRKGKKEGEKEGEGREGEGRKGQEGQKGEVSHLPHHPPLLLTLAPSVLQEDLNDVSTGGYGCRSPILCHQVSFLFLSSFFLDLFIFYVTEVLPFWR